MNGKTDLQGMNFSISSYSIRELNLGLRITVSFNVAGCMTLRTSSHGSQVYSIDKGIEIG